MRQFAEHASRSLKRLLKAGLERAGYRILRTNSRELRLTVPSHDASRPLPPGATEYLRNDHPRLIELKHRYSNSSLPMANHSQWSAAYRAREIPLLNFRGDNAYVWQFRNTRSDERRKYYLYARYLQDRDPRRLLSSLGEDGLFGCWIFEYRAFPPLSRDLLDSVNEIYFLDRHCDLFQQPSLKVLDIGAGYGRLAHRMLTAVPSLGHYYCTDAVPESTFLSEYYLRFRGCADRSTVVPLDEIESRLGATRIDLAVNIHSFSEMPYRAIDGWLSLLARKQVPRLLIVPNDADKLLSREADRTRRDFAPLLAQYGYLAAVEEPIILDPDIRELVGITDRIFLFERRG
ncbi:MAG: putative sugar O-methyltransferase [Gammaproteobacteria bacterium]|nr:putative sugar O-methyltransferase [Gammaproteobacteria bacterium]